MSFHSVPSISIFPITKENQFFQECQTLMQFIWKDSILVLNWISCNMSYYILVLVLFLLDLIKIEDGLFWWPEGGICYLNKMIFK